MSPIRRRWTVAAIVAVAVIGLDLSRPPPSQWSARILVAGIDVYQATLSKLMPSAGVHCRFEPTCSHYAEGAIRKYGTLVGSGKAAWRIARCGPWTEAGTVDPP